MYSSSCGETESAVYWPGPESFPQYRNRNRTTEYKLRGITSTGLERTEDSLQSFSRQLLFLSLCSTFNSITRGKSEAISKCKDCHSLQTWRMLKCNYLIVIPPAEPDILVLAVSTAVPMKTCALPTIPPPPP